MLDTRVLLMARGIDGRKVWENGGKMADEWLEEKKNAELANIKRQTQNILDPESRFAKMIGLAKQSKRSPWLIADIEAEKGAMAQAEIANREKMAGIDKTMSETNKNNADASQTVQKTGQARMGALQSAYQILADSGDIRFARMNLGQAYASGAIDEDTFYNASAELDELQNTPNLTPDMVGQYGFAKVKSMLDPKYIYQTMDNQANNETERYKSDNSLYGTQYTANINAETEAQKIALKKFEIEQDSAYKQQQLFLQQNKPVHFAVDENGIQHAVFADGKGIVVLGEDGQPLRVKAKETLAERHERQNKVLDFKYAEEQANAGLTLVQNIQELHKKVSENPYMFKAYALIPGTDEYTLLKDLETLRANVFLSQIPQMKGMGALTDAEGLRLENALGSLDPYSGNFGRSLQDIKETFGRLATQSIQRQAIYSNHQQTVDEEFKGIN